ncbi:MAG: hypothetical protein ACTSYA_04700 [Candidatus Kariarchaeaceae archaeon]
MPVCVDCGAFYIRSPCPSCGYNKDKASQIIKNGPSQVKRPRAIPKDTPSWESVNKGISLSQAVTEPRVPKISPQNKAISTDDLQEFKDEVNRTLKQVVNLIEQLLNKTA